MDIFKKDRWLIMKQVFESDLGGYGYLDEERGEQKKKKSSKKLFLRRGEKKEREKRKKGGDKLFLTFVMENVKIYSNYEKKKVQRHVKKRKV